jgi:hypothetical protein
MLAALIAGERHPKALPQLARRRLRAKLSLLEEAFCGRFSGHHGFLLLSRIDRASADIVAVEAKVEVEIGSFWRRWTGWMRSGVGRAWPRPGRHPLPGPGGRRAAAAVGRTNTCWGLPAIARCCRIRRSSSRSAAPS